VCKALGITPGALAEAARGADRALLSLALAYSVLHHVFLGADKQNRVFTALGLFPGFWGVLRARLGSGPLRAFLPVDAGELVAALFYWRAQDIPVETAVGAVVYDRGLNLLGSLFWLGAGLLTLGGGNALPPGAGWMLAGMGYAVFFALPQPPRALLALARRLGPRAGKRAENALGPFLVLGARQKLLLLAYGVVFQARPLLVAWMLFAATGIPVPPDSFVAGVSLALLAGHAPTPAGTGPREAAFVLIFAGAAPAPVLLATGLALTLTVHVVPMAVGAPWTPWLLRRMAEGKRGD
jgi:hypothetical protein